MNLQMLLLLFLQKLKQIAERRLSEDENDDEAYGLLGRVARAEGDKKKAVEYYEKALDCNDNEDEYLSSLLELRMELQWWNTESQRFFCSYSELIKLSMLLGFHFMPFSKCSLLRAANDTLN